MRTCRNARTDRYSHFNPIYNPIYIRLANRHGDCDTHFHAYQNSNPTSYRDTRPYVNRNPDPYSYFH